MQSPGNDAAIDQLGWERSEGIRAQRTQRTKERSMHVGMMRVFASYGWENCPDARGGDEEIRLARLGFKALCLEDACLEWRPYPKARLGN